MILGEPVICNIVEKVKMYDTIVPIASDGSNIRKHGYFKLGSMILFESHYDIDIVINFLIICCTSMLYGYNTPHRTLVSL